MAVIIKWEMRVQQIGSTKLISLPKRWCDAWRINKGDILQVGVTETGDLLISPSGGDSDARA